MAKTTDNTDVVQAIDAASQKYGLDPTVLMTLAYIETGGSYDPMSKNPNSSAKGLFQFVNKTGKGYGLTGAEAYDAELAADAAARLTLDNMRGLRKKLGREPTIGEIYLAHQQGLGGALQILNSPQGSNAVSILGYDAVRLNTPQFDGETNAQFIDRVNNMTVGDFSNQWINKAEQVATTRLPPGYVPAVGTLRDTQPQFMAPTSPMSMFFEVPPRPQQQTPNIGYERQAEANRQGGRVGASKGISQAMPDASRSNVVVPAPRMASRGGPQPSRMPPTQLPMSTLGGMQVMGPATNNSSGQPIHQNQLQAIQDTHGYTPPAPAKPPVPGLRLPTLPKPPVPNLRIPTVTAPYKPTVRVTEAPAVAPSTASRDPVGPGATQAGVDAFRRSGTTPAPPSGSRVTTEYVRPDGTKRKAVIPSTAPMPVARPSSIPPPKPPVPGLRLPTLPKAPVPGLRLPTLQPQIIPPVPLPRTARPQPVVAAPPKPVANPAPKAGLPPPTTRVTTGYDVSGGNNAFNPSSMQSSDRWQTGYKNGGYVRR